MDKSNFLKFYANLPISVRKEAVLVLEKVGPITWEVAYREVFAETELGKIILQKIDELGFIPK